jgi:hypothetical protein
MSRMPLAERATTCAQCDTSLTPRQISCRNKYCSQACMGMATRTVPADRFWHFVTKGADCWEWTGNRIKDGYGTIGDRDTVCKRVYAHRLSWEIHFGPIPDGLFVCHHCDNRLCVRPDHLFLGTFTDNMQDMVQKGRQASGDRNGYRKYPQLARKGESAPMAKLQDDDVRAIRSEYAQGGISQEALASRFGVAQALISGIILRKRWRHID